MILLAAFFAAWQRFVRWCSERVLPEDALRLPADPIRPWGLPHSEREEP